MKEIALKILKRSAGLLFMFTFGCFLLWCMGMLAETWWMMLGVTIFSEIYCIFVYPFKK
jgi:hypothetical protein